MNETIEDLLPLHFLSSHEKSSNLFQPHPPKEDLILVKKHPLQGTLMISNVEVLHVNTKVCILAHTLKNPVLDRTGI
jgi:hypothetical protein